MRKLKLQVQMTVDGYMAGPDGEMDWMCFDWDDALVRYVQELTAPVDCILLGRKLAEGFIPHWAANPAGEDPSGIAKMNETPKVVFTRTLHKSEWDNTVLAKDDLADEVNALRQQRGGDIIAYGGASFVSALVKHALIDEYHVFVNPTAIGTGMAIFSTPGRQDLKLIGATAFACGVVALQYEPKRR